METTKIRLQKRLADAGYGSRRAIEAIISDGRIMLNGKVATLGDKASIDDVVHLDGRQINSKRYLDSQTKVLMLNKAIGVICSTKDTKNRPIVYEQLPQNMRWIMVGRLDINSSGLLLFTNHGELAKHLMHPSFEVVREYRVRILGNLDKKQIQYATQGIKVDGQVLRFQSIKFINGLGANQWYRICLCSGKNREIRRLLAALGFQVSRLIRVRYGDILLPKKLAANQWQYLTHKQVNAMLRLVNLEVAYTDKK